MLKIGHAVTRPGRILGDEAVTINVPEELETVPGIVQKPQEVDFYSREDPLGSLAVDNTADRDWLFSVVADEQRLEFKLNYAMNVPIIKESLESGEVEPTAEAEPGKDITAEIKRKARELGFGEVGITRFDKRYVYRHKRNWAKFPHAICLAYEQEYESTQSIPSIEAEKPHFGTYRIMGAKALELADLIRSLGYHAQVHSSQDNTAPYIPMFVEAGLGQLGANGQLLSPHFGSRARIMAISTDAQVTYDQPVDYGIHAFCSICQVCVNRCPGRALMREKVWWRGVQKHKLIYKRCHPVMARYQSCGVCMKVCPVQRYGMNAVIGHYVETGQVLGKGTHMLEGYSMQGQGYFGPGELPHFSNDFFQAPHGKNEDVLFEELKDRIKAGQVPDGPQGDAVLNEFKQRVAKYVLAAEGDLVDPSALEART